MMLSLRQGYITLKFSAVCLIMLFLFLPQICLSQLQPLSRNDKAAVQKSIQAYESAKEINNMKEASRHLNDLAYLYWEHNDYRKAIEYYEQSMEFNKNLNNENGLAMLHNNLGMLYSDIGEYLKSLEYFKKTLAARRAYKSKEGMIAALKNIAVVQNNLKMFDESVKDLQEALSMARETNDPDQISSCFLMLSETYEKAGELENTKHYYELYQQFSTMKKDREIIRIQQIADEETILKEIERDPHACFYG